MRGETVRWLIFPFVFLFIISICAVPVSAESGNETQVLKNVVSGGLDVWMGNTASKLMEDTPISGNISETSVFGPIVAPVNVSEKTFSEMETEKFTVYTIGKIIILLIVLYVLLQEFKPSTAAGITKFVNGTATYYYPYDIFSYAIKLGLWFVCGPLIIIGMVLWNNDIISGMDTSVLNQVVVSTDNWPNLLTLGVGTKFLKYYFAIREILIICAIKKWYFLGLILFWKRVRWVGVLILQYMAVQIFSQVFFVVILTTAVAYVVGGGMEWYNDMTVYGGVSIFMLILAFVALTIPVWIRLFSPSTFKWIVDRARSV
jgi:hypothetical protein